MTAWVEPRWIRPALIVALGAGCGRTGLDGLARPQADDAAAPYVQPTFVSPAADTRTAAAELPAESPPEAQAPLPQVLKIAAGGHTACALGRDGLVKCWGASEATAVTLPGISGATDVSVMAGATSSNNNGRPTDIHDWDPSCAVANGAVYCWSGRASPQALRIEAVAVSVGVEQSCALNGRGEVRCWGLSHVLDPWRGKGQRGATDSMPIPDLTGSVAVSAGGDLVCALAVDGAVRCWGNLGWNHQQPSPAPPPLLETMAVPSAVDVFAADSYYCAVGVAGGVTCQGCLYDGNGGGPYFSCGLDAYEPASLGDRAVLQIRASYTHRCARLSDGAVRCWGNNGYGQLGYVGQDAAMPVRDVDGVTGVVDVAVGLDFSCALTASGAVSCWGGNNGDWPGREHVNLRQVSGL